MATSMNEGRRFATCDLYDEFGEEARVIGSDFIEFGGRSKFSGRAVTIKCWEDNSLVRLMVQSPGAGRVLVVDGGGNRRCALLGDMLAKEAVANGWQGIIIDGSVRDSAELKRLDIGIRALGTTPRKSKRSGQGQQDLEIQVAGISIKPGDAVFCDEDGIIVLDDPNLLV